VTKKHNSPMMNKNIQGMGERSQDFSSNEKKVVNMW
jgi:hypothetical protein